MIIDHSHLRNLLGRMRADAAASWGAVSHLASETSDDVAALGIKVSVTESAVRVCTDAVQVLGGYGYMRDYGLEKTMRDAAVLSLLPLSNARAELLITSIENERL
jgi:alkylation response protein AidB-like acyl-CoA dehydrogenase